MYKNLIAITNRHLCDDFMEQIKKVISKKPYGLILREKDLDDDAYRKMVVEISALCEAADVIFFIHSHGDMAVELGVKNIHFSIEGIKNYGGDISLFDKVSVSCHSMEDMELAVSLGATQIVLGTIFETSCKPGLKGYGLDFLKTIATACPVPLYAIGGITTSNLPQVLSAGATGACMMSPFMSL